MNERSSFDAIAPDPATIERHFAILFGYLDGLVSLRLFSEVGTPTQSVVCAAHLANSDKDGGSDGRGMGFYYRNVTETVLFGVRGKGARTLAAGRRQTNLIATCKREHSRKPDELYPIIEACSPGPFIELFARGRRDRWTGWGHEMPMAAE